MGPRAVLATAALLCLAAAAHGLHMGFVALVELGHLNPLLSVALEAAGRGHTVDLLFPNFFNATCTKMLPADCPKTLRCVGYTDFSLQRIGDEFFEDLTVSPAFETFSKVEAEQIRYANVARPALHRYFQALPAAQRPDIFVVDFAEVLNGVPVADALGVPAVLMWPLTLAFPIGPGGINIPAIATANPGTMSFPQRMGNGLLRVLSGVSQLQATVAINEKRRAIGAPETQAGEIFWSRQIIAPGIFGLDQSQPLCPNVEPVGFLQRDLSPEEAHLPDEWASWLRGCSVGAGRKGVVYVNMGSVARLPAAWVAVFEAAGRELVNQGYCVLWKRRGDAAKDAVPFPPEMRVEPWLPFSPRALLAHGVAVFVTHCGDTSVYEAVDFVTPMVGIPLFADQPDMCARLEDSGAGIALDKRTLTPEGMVQAVEKIASDPTVQPKLRVLRAIGRAQGGPRRAADIIERTAELGTADLVCTAWAQPWWRRCDLDIALVIASVLLAAWMLLKRLLRCCRGKPTAAARSH